jgi:membrane protein YdbS with pleckstrin-like domain
VTVAPEAGPDPAKSRDGPKKQPRRVRINGWTGFKQMLVEMALYLPDGSFVLIWTLKVLGFVLYLVQIPLTYALMRLDYELRWYVVTDRSLRLRTGIWRVREMTMSFANLQQIAVSQGPLQRLLGLADVRVQSAGGGGTAHPGHPTPGRRSLHTGHFHAVDNAEEIRDLIVERLRRFRETGLGDPDEVLRGAGRGADQKDRPDLAAVQVLLAEARALRSVLR